MSDICCSSWHDTALSRVISGHGFVNFLEKAGADMAVMALNGIQLSDGQKLEVSLKAPAITNPAITS